jgi:hypothetical protein
MKVHPESILSKNEIGRRIRECMDMELQCRVMKHRDKRPIGVNCGSLIKELVRRFDRVKDDEMLPEHVDMHYIPTIPAPSGINFVLAGSRYIEQIPKER